MRTNGRVECWLRAGWQSAGKVKAISWAWRSLESQKEKPPNHLISDVCALQTVGGTFRCSNHSKPQQTTRVTVQPQKPTDMQKAIKDFSL